MSEFISASSVFLGQSAATADDALRLLAAKAVEAGLSSDAEGVYAALRSREDAGTTAMSGGFSIPHAKGDAVSRSGVVVAKFPEGVDWGSSDGAPVTCAIAIFTPASEAGTTHLQMLSKVAALLMDEGFRSGVQAADDAEKIAELVGAGLDEA